MSDENKIKWIYCNSCNRQTNHELKYEHHHVDDEEIEPRCIIWWNDSWYVWQCRGCNELIFEKTHEFSENVDFQGRPFIDSTFYPEPNHELMTLKKYKNIPPKLKSLYEELVQSFNSSCYLVCSIGTRALLEGIMVNKEVNGSNLKTKIDSAEFIPKSIRENLHGFRFLGNDAAHQLVVPKKEDLQTAIYVIEDILNVSYELDYNSKIIFDKFKGNR